MAGLFLQLPIPPSVNAAFINRRPGGAGRGRIKSAKYRAWLTGADGYYQLQGLGRLKPIRGPYAVEICLPKIRGDCDNRIKCVVDWLVSRGLVDDDRHMRKCSVEIDGDVQGLCEVTVRAC